MNIDEKLSVFFKNRAKYYSLFLDLLSEIDYLILNLYDYGVDKRNISGDLDIVIEPKDYESIVIILKEQNFIKYIESNTNQTQWIKYVDKVGIIQIHIHLDICFNNKKIISFKSLSYKNHFLDVNEEYILFLIQTYYKNKFNKKASLKLSFLESKISNQVVEELLKLKYFEYNKICKYTIDNIMNNYQPTKKEFFFKLLKDDFFPTATFIVKIIKNKFFKMITLNSNDIEIIFIGVDGAGKSTTIENIKLALNNEVMFKSHYFGLKTSVINNIRDYLSPKKSIINHKKDNFLKQTKKNKLSIKKKLYFLSIGILYWLEYNFKYLFKVKLNSIVPSTVHCIDRSYYDALLYYDIKFLNILFFKYTFKPSVIVYLTGDSQLLYERKKEIPLKEINFNKSKYSDFISKANFYGLSTLTIDSTDSDEFNIQNLIMHEIFEFLWKSN